LGWSIQLRFEQRRRTRRPCFCRFDRLLGSCCRAILPFASWRLRNPLPAYSPSAEHRHHEKTVGTFVGSLDKYEYRSASISRPHMIAKSPLRQWLSLYRTLPRDTGEVGLSTAVPRQHKLDSL